ncbi:MAG: hypothetical protein KC416_07135, partial [Myxococcales bacterium]|nr:hypothetical protein [Myxococcales bacterium]
TLLALAIPPGVPRPTFRAPYRWLVREWKGGWVQKVWLGLAALLALALLGFGVACFVAGSKLGIATVALKWGKRLAIVPLAIPVAIVAGQGAYWLGSRLGRFRMVPLLIAGLGIGTYVSQAFLPSLSAHFSPREVYDQYNAIAEEGEPLAEFRAGSRAAAYYARGEIAEMKTQDELVKFLLEPGRRWAIFPTDELAPINRAFRAKSGKHLFVADARSATVILAANEPVSGRENENFVADTVLEEPPAKIQHPVSIRFDDRIELIGYDLDLPHGDYVGASEKFKVTWYWKALRSGSGSYKVFLHVDGYGLRLNGDHEPVDGKYPVRLWDEGDIVRDVQTLAVPANFRSGTYTFYIGLFSGSNRMKITEGKGDGDDRGVAGTLTIR